MPLPDLAFLSEAACSSRDSPPICKSRCSVGAFSNLFELNLSPPLKKTQMENDLLSLIQNCSFALLKVYGLEHRAIDLNPAQKIDQHIINELNQLMIYPTASQQN